MTNDPAGSTWKKWDLHVHTPSSVVHNYQGAPDDAWEAFLLDLEALPPEFKVIGIAPQRSAISRMRFLNACVMGMPWTNRSARAIRSGSPATMTGFVGSMGGVARRVSTMMSRSSPKS